MNEACKHCMHVAWTNHADHETVTEYRCCHCRHEKTERVPNRTQGWFSSSEGHGPHAPDWQARF